VPGDECQFAYLQAGLPSGLRACAGWISSPQYQGPYRLGPGASRLRQRATPRLTATYEGWHLPLFFVLDSFRGFTPVTLPGFVLGITCGAVILTWVYNGTGGSVLLVALWHITYNMTSATEAAKGTVAAVVSTFVMVWAIALVVLELTAVRRGRPAPLRWRDPPVSRPYALRNRTVNLVVRAFLASPLHRLLSGSVLVLTYRGVRSGCRHTLPVQYSMTAAASLCSPRTARTSAGGET
jgi:hypothetical protein